MGDSLFLFEFCLISGATGNDDWVCRVHPCARRFRLIPKWPMINSSLNEPQPDFSVVHRDRMRRFEFSLFFAMCVAARRNILRQRGENGEHGEIWGCEKTGGKKIWSLESAPAATILTTLLATCPFSYELKSSFSVELMHSLLFPRGSP